MDSRCWKSNLGLPTLKSTCRSSASNSKSSTDGSTISSEQTEAKSAFGCVEQTGRGNSTHAGFRPPLRSGPPAKRSSDLPLRSLLLLPVMSWTPFNKAPDEDTVTREDDSSRNPYHAPSSWAGREARIHTSAHEPDPLEGPTSYCFLKQQI